MSFARVQTSDRELNQVQSNIATALQPFFNNPLLQGRIIESVSLSVGTTTIYHALGRKILGWFITDIDGAAQIYSADTDTPQLNLDLVSDAAVTVNLYVF